MKKSDIEKVKEVLEAQELSGDVWQPEDEIIVRCQVAYPRLIPRDVRGALRELCSLGEVVQREGDWYGLKETVRAERQLATRIADYIAHPHLLYATAPTEQDNLMATEEASLQLGIGLAQSQYKAVAQALGCRLSIIYGGPGTGKTTTLKALCQAYEIMHRYDRIMLLAPTGKAARRMAEQTERDAATIHSVIYSGYGCCQYRYQEGELAPGLVVVDEASMLSVVLLNDLLRALSDRTQVILVGDPAQLPSVGPGNVLGDLLASGVPAFELTDNFRQQAGSILADNVMRVREGDDALVFGEDTTYLSAGSDAETEALVIAIAYHLQHEGKSVQILTPIGQGGGVCSAAEINTIIRDWLNPPAPDKLEVVIGGQTYRVGDKVMQTHNNEAAKNGEVGVITSITGEDEISIGIHFGDAIHPVSYSVDVIERDDLITHAYAVTIHKSQGSEYDYVIIPVAKAHTRSWVRPAIYTALSRAKKGAYIIGDLDVLEAAIATPATERHTDLLPLIRAHLGQAA